MKDNGALFLNVGASPSNPMLPHEIAKTFADHLFVLQNPIHWIKSITLDDEDKEEPITRAFQADLIATVSERQPRIRFPFHEGREDAD